MSDEERQGPEARRSLLRRFVEDFGVPPESPSPPLIPPRWRIPVFVSMIVVGLVLLALLLWLVVAPAVHAQSCSAASIRTACKAV